MHNVACEAFPQNIVSFPLRCFDIIKTLPCEIRFLVKTVIGHKDKKNVNSCIYLRFLNTNKKLVQRLYNEFSELMNLNVQVKRHKLDEVLIKGTVDQIIPVMDEKTDRILRRSTEDEATTATESISEGAKKKVEYFQVKLRDGNILKASRVVVATGPTRAQMANIPSWVKNIGESFPDERLQHTVQLMHHRPAAQHRAADLECEGQKDAEGKSDVHFTLPFSQMMFQTGTCIYGSDCVGSCVVHEAGQRVMVVGGGLTSAHVISAVLKQGASHVTWVMRKHLQV